MFGKSKKITRRCLGSGQEDQTGDIFTIFISILAQSTKLWPAVAGEQLDEGVIDKWLDANVFFLSSSSPSW